MSITAMRLVFLIFCSLLAVSVMVLALLVIEHQQRLASVSGGNTEALCTIRSTQEQEYQQTQVYLQDPSLYPAFSDENTVSVIRAQQEQRKATIDALSDIECPDVH